MGRTLVVRTVDGSGIVVGGLCTVGTILESVRGEEGFWRTHSWMDVMLITYDRKGGKVGG